MRVPLIRVAMITAFGMLAVAAAAGCKAHDQLVLDTICDRICACTDPDFQFDCDRECRFEIEPEQISQECFDCFLEEQESSCTTLEQVCEPLCDFDGTPPPVEFDAPFFQIDAPGPVPFAWSPP